MSLQQNWVTHAENEYNDQFKIVTSIGRATLLRVYKLNLNPLLGKTPKFEERPLPRRSTPRCLFIASSHGNLHIYLILHITICHRNRRKQSPEATQQPSISSLTPRTEKTINLWQDRRRTSHREPGHIGFDTYIVVRLGVKWNSRKRDMHLIQSL